MSFQTITLHTPFLACYKSEHGNGIDREYLILLDKATSQEVNLQENTLIRYTNKQGELCEYLHPEIMQEVGFLPCDIREYINAQDELQKRREAHAVSSLQE